MMAPAESSVGIMDVIGGIALTALLTMTGALWRQFTAFRREVDRGLVEISTALKGYRDSGGLIGDVETLKREAATVDGRIQTSRHALRSELQGVITSVENEMKERQVQFERQIRERLGDVAERRSRPREQGESRGSL